MLSQTLLRSFRPIRTDIHTLVHRAERDLPHRLGRLRQASTGRRSIITAIVQLRTFVDLYVPSHLLVGS